MQNIQKDEGVQILQIALARCGLNLTLCCLQSSAIQQKHSFCGAHSVPLITLSCTLIKLWDVKSKFLFQASCCFCPVPVVCSCLPGLQPVFVWSTRVYVLDTLIRRFCQHSWLRAKHSRKALWGAGFVFNVSRSYTCLKDPCNAF